jgi:hypothetical protein
VLAFVVGSSNVLLVFLRLDQSNARLVHSLSASNSLKLTLEEIRECFSIVGILPKSNKGIDCLRISGRGIPAPVRMSQLLLSPDLLVALVLSDILAGSDLDRVPTLRPD